MAITVKTNEPLASRTTFAVGGPAAHFVSVTTEAELVEAVAYARAHQLSLSILGGGSNVLVSDAGVEGLVVEIAIKGVEVQQDASRIYLTVAAGELLDDVIASCVEQGYWGLENLSHIPGTVGATPVQNVGAYGVEVSERITLVRVLDVETETFTTLDAVACQFAYRDSLFKHEAGKRYVVTAVTYLLTTTPTPVLTYRDLAERFVGTTPSLAGIRDTVITIRGAKFPDWRHVGTAGSFFKNPIISRAHYDVLLQSYPELPHYPVDVAHVKVPLGWVLDKLLNLKGDGTTTVGCYEGQALVLINRGGATAAEVTLFADTIAKAVREKLDIDIEWEVTKF